MKLLLKILFLILAIFQTNISEAKEFVFNGVFSEVTFSNVFNFEKCNDELEIVFLENDPVRANLTGNNLCKGLGC